jgi:predicted amidohydrolase YtcJ
MPQQQHHRTVTTPLLLLLAVAASLSHFHSEASAALSDVETADLILHNGVIETVDQTLGRVEALAVRDGRIIAVGTDEEIKALGGPETKLIDLAGRFAMPGFIEGHGHFVGLGQAKMNLDLMNVRSWDEVIALVAEAVAKTQPGEWIIGRGWHQEKWDKVPDPNVEGFPTHHALSAVSPDNPVFLTHASGHASFANAKAMEIAGVSGGTPDPEGGEILRDENGEPIGSFRETASGLIERARARDEAARAENERQEHGQNLRATGEGGMLRGQFAQLDRAIDLATAECLSKGVTSFQDAGSSFAVIDRLSQRAESGELGIRLWLMIREPNDVIRENIAEYTPLQRVGDGFLTVGGIKRTIDGALGSRGAWLLEPYADSPDSTGLATATIEDVTETAKLALEHDLQLCVHAIGDRANRAVLDIYEKTLSTQRDNLDARWRIEHAQHLHPDDIPRFGELDVIASMQGIHCTSDAPWVYARLGAARAESGAYMWRDLFDSGAIISNGTDAPVEDVDPIASFYASVSRRLKDGTQFFPEQCMTRMEALRSYTINAAYAAREEDIKGTLSPGKFADIVILSQNILTVEENQIPATKVEMTIVGGEVVYENEN